MPFIRNLALLVGLLLPLMLAAGTWADDPDEPGPDAVRAQLPALLGELDSPDFAARQRAEGRLENWLLRPELRLPLAECFQQRLLDPGPG